MPVDTAERTHQWLAKIHNRNSRIKTSTKIYERRGFEPKGGTDFQRSRESWTLEWVDPGGTSSRHEERTVEELKERAKELDLHGYSKLKKSELIDTLRRH